METEGNVMKDPNIWKLTDLLKSVNETSTEIGGSWVPARPLGCPSIRHRFRAAWKVLTGKADAVIWPGGQ